MRQKIYIKCEKIMNFQIFQGKAYNFSKNFILEKIGKIREN